MKWAQREQTFMTIATVGAIFFSGWIACAMHFNMGARWDNEAKLVQAEQVTIPHLETALHQAQCDRARFASFGVKAKAADESDDIDAPGWADFHGCPKVKAVKPPPIEAIVKK